MAENAYNQEASRCLYEIPYVIALVGLLTRCYQGIFIFAFYKYIQLTGK
jgi:hypothetical protein